MESYQIKAICKRCNKPISYRTDRIKSHLATCKGENDGDEIVSLVRYRDDIEKDGREFNNSYRNESDTITASNEIENNEDGGYSAPYKKYGVSSDKWDRKYGDDSGIIDYEKNPDKRYRSETESEDSDESPKKE